MKRIRVELSAEIVRKIDCLNPPNLSRSGAIEEILLNYLQTRELHRGQQQDLEKIDAAAERLNAEAEDVLTYQAADRSFFNQ